MGNSHVSVCEDKHEPPSYIRNLDQQGAFITLAGLFPKAFSVTAELVQNASTGGVTAASDASIDIIPGDVKLTNISGTLMMSACAYKGRSEVDNLLDGFSAALVARIQSTDKGWRLDVACRPIKDAQFNRELEAVYDESGEIDHVIEKKNVDIAPGLFAGKTWRCKALCSHCCNGTAVQRSTVHQPIWIGGRIIFCSGVQYSGIGIANPPIPPTPSPTSSGTAADSLVTVVCKPLPVPSPPIPPLQLIDRGEEHLCELFPRAKQAFHCMHPSHDLNFGRRLMLTYTFTHHVWPKERTRITFWELNYDTGAYVSHKVVWLDGYRALHMFGFTQNYFVLFANPLKVNPCKFFCQRKPVLRSIDDTLTCDLIIYLWKRPGAEPDLPDSMAIETMQHGNIYHTVNCFESEIIVEDEDGEDESGSIPGGRRRRTITVDGWVSHLNAARESSQFELKQDAAHCVHDNSGDLYRYTIHLQPTLDAHGKPLQKKKLAPSPAPPPVPFLRVDCKLRVNDLDTSIDFHCLNPYVSGREYEHFWLIQCERCRDYPWVTSDGSIAFVDSRLVCIDVKTGSYTAWSARKSGALPHCSEVDGHHMVPISYYLRTPMFIPKSNPHAQLAPDHEQRHEKTGYIAVWCYRVVPNVFKKAAAGAGSGLDDASPKVKPIQRRQESGGKIDRQATSLSGSNVAPANINPWPMKEESVRYDSSALLLIFDCEDFRVDSRPIVVCFKNQHIPFSVHSYTHDLDRAAQAREKMMRGHGNANGAHGHGHMHSTVSASTSLDDASAASPVGGAAQVRPAQVGDENV